MNFRLSRRKTPFFLSKYPADCRKIAAIELGLKEQKNGE